MEKKHLDQLVPHLYISDWDSSNDIHLLKKDNIKAIISLTTYDKPNNVLDFYTKNNIDHLDIDILDAPFANISKFFDTTYDFIKKHIDKGDNVLVHCMAGISRSSTIILNYLLRESYERNEVKVCPCKLLQSILEYTRNIRPIINPNPGFMKQLLEKSMEYQKKWKKDYNYKIAQTRQNIY